MKAKLQQNHRVKQKHNSKVMQLSNLTELSDQEAELVIGGCSSCGGDTDMCWGSGGNTGGGSGTPTGG